MRRVVVAAISDSAAWNTFGITGFGDCRGSVGSGIGSQEASRFHPGMGTLFLTHLGELMGLLLAEHQGVATGDAR